MVNKTKTLRVTMQRLLKRGAESNIRRILKKNHSADIAATLEFFSPEEKIEIFNLENSFDKKAEIFSYLQTKSQEIILKRLTNSEILSVISLLELDDAADILGSLPYEESQVILASMQRKDSEDVADLMSYPDDSAGGLMTSDFFSVNQNLSVEQTIKEIQSEENESKVVFYIYVTNDSNQLVGVINLKQLLLSKKTDLLKNIMQSDVVSVSIETDQTDVAKAVERYDFLSIPVVDSSYFLVGVITIDDVLDVIREEAKEDLLQMGTMSADLDISLWSHFKARILWQVLSFSVGLVCFFMLHRFKESIFGVDRHNVEHEEVYILIFLIPLLLTLGKTASTQTVTNIVDHLRTEEFEMREIFIYFFKEIILSLVFAFIFGSLSFLVSYPLFDNLNLGLMTSFAVSSHLFLCVSLGGLFAYSFSKLRNSPVIVLIPAFGILSNLLALLVLLVSYYLFV